MRQVVVKAEVSDLSVRRWQTIAGEIVMTEALIHTEDWFEATDYAVEPTEGLSAIVCFHPITLGVLTVRIFRTQAKGSTFRFPPDMRTIKILMDTLEKAIIGETNLKPLIGQIETCAPSRRTLREEILIVDTT